MKDYAEKGITPRPRRARDPPIVRAAHSPSGEWTSGFGTTLEDAYRDRGAVSPSFTTKTRCAAVGNRTGHEERCRARRGREGPEGRVDDWLHVPLLKWSEYYRGLRGGIVASL